MAQIQWRLKFVWDTRTLHTQLHLTHHSRYTFNHLPGGSMVAVATSTSPLLSMATTVKVTGFVKLISKGLTPEYREARISYLLQLHTAPIFCIMSAPDASRGHRKLSRLVLYVRSSCRCSGGVRHDKQTGTFQTREANWP